MQLKTVGESLTALNKISGILNNTALVGLEQNIALTNSLNGYSIETVKAAIAQGTFTAEQIKAILTAKGLTDAEIQEVIATNALTASQTGAATSTLGLGAAFKGLGASMKAFALSNPILTAIAAVGATIYGAVKAYDALTVSVEEANEAMQDAVGEYESAKSSLESINSELEEQNKKLDELLAKDKLTYAEQGELEELQAITKELMLQQDIEERRAANASKEASERTVDAYEKQYGRYDKTEEDLQEKLSYENFPIPENADDVLGMIAAYIRAKELLEQSQKEFDEAVKNGEDTTWLDEDVQFNIDAVDDYRQALDENISDLQEKRLALEDEYNKAIEKRETGVEPLTSSDKDVIETYESIYDVMRMVYEYTDKNTWKSMQIGSVFDTEGIEKTKEELIEMVKAGEFDENTLQSYPKLSAALEQNKVSASELRNELEALADAEGSMGGDALNTGVSSSLFNIDTYKEQIDNIQSSISTLRSALDSFNSGTMDETAVLDLMQEFPSLIPYVDLAADGFGDLSQGLSDLIAQQPDSLIQDLELLKESFNTDEECSQVDELINSLQALSSYGDTGMEAYATAIGSTWDDTANVIETVTTQFENLAKVQEAVAGGLTMSATAAAELAKMYPEILTNAEISADGQVTLNEGVVNSILDGDKSIIDAQIAKLEADKAGLEAKKSYAEAQLNIVKQVSEGEGEITREIAQYRIDIANELLHALIEAGMEEDRAYAAVAENMAGNMEEYNRIVGEIAEDTSLNMDAAAVSMADSININAINAQKSFKAMQDSVKQLAASIKGAANGEVTGDTIAPAGGGSTSKGGVKAKKHKGDFNAAQIKYTPMSNSLKDFQSQLEIDIKGYTDAIANIDSQIAVLKNLQLTFDNNGGVGGHGYSDKIKDLEKEKDKINNAIDDAKGSGSKAGKDSTKEMEDTYEELVDFFERRNKVLSDAFSLLKTNLDNVTGAFAKNKLIDVGLAITEERFKNYSDAFAMYSQKANEAMAKLPSDIASKIKDGAVDLTTFIGEGNKDVVEAVKDYEDWAGKVSECKQELAELKTQLAQLELDKFNNVVQDFSDRFDLRDSGKDLMKKQIILVEESGRVVGDSLYKSQIAQTRKQIDILNEEKAALAGQMTDALKSGRVQKGSEQWLEMVNGLKNVEASILDCKTEVEQFYNEIEQLEVDKFGRIAGHFTDMQDALESSNDLIGKQIGLLEESGELTGASYYEQQKAQAEKQVSLLEQKRSLLAGQLNSSVSSGLIKEGSDEWLEMVNTITDVDKSILDCKTSMEEFDNAILNIHTEVFSRIQDQFSSINSELSNLTGLFDEFEVADGKGIWTDKGLAQLGLLAQQYELAEYQVQKYNEEIDRLTGLYLEGRYSVTEYTDKLAELTSEQWKAVNASESAKDSIIELNKARIDKQIDGINKEVEAFRKLTDAQTDALKASKDLHDYEKSIAEKTDTVTDLERRIAAMQNDTSAAAIAKRKKLEDELAGAKSDLEEAQYQHSVEQQEKSLNEMYDTYKAEKDAEIEKLEASLEERELLLFQSFASVKENTQAIADEITRIAESHGIAVSNTLMDAWKSGCDAVAGYGQTLTESSSVFIAELSGVEQGIYGLQAQTDESSKALAGMFATQADNLVTELQRTYEAENQLNNESCILQGTLADMFSTRADNLVSQLTASYYSEQNLGYMTQALRDSLVNTLERGYNISGISGALESIKSSVNSVASAASNAAQALASMGAAQQAYNNAAASTPKATGTKTISTPSSNKAAIREAGYTDKFLKTLSGNNNKPTMIKYAKGGIVTKDRNNPLNHIAESVGEDTLVAAKEGESILTPKQTETLKMLAEKLGGRIEGGAVVLSSVEPEQPIPHVKSMVQMPTMASWMHQDMSGSLYRMPEPIPNSPNRSTVTLSMDRMIHIDHVDSTNIRQMESIANKAVDKFAKELNDLARFGRV